MLKWIKRFFEFNREFWKRDDFSTGRIAASMENIRLQYIHPPKIEFSIPDFEIKKMNLKRGDILVFYLKHKISCDGLVNFRESIKKSFPGMRAMVLEEETKVNVLSKKERLIKRIR